MISTCQSLFPHRRRDWRLDDRKQRRKTLVNVYVPIKNNIYMYNIFLRVFFSLIARRTYRRLVFVFIFEYSRIMRGGGERAKNRARTFFDPSIFITVPRPRAHRTACFRAKWTRAALRNLRAAVTGNLKSVPPTLAAFPVHREEKSRKQ